MVNILKYFLPNYEYNNLWEIDESIFANKKLVVFDIDNTIFLSETTDIPKEILDWLSNFSRAHKCIFVSNSGTLPIRASVIIEKTGVPVFLSKHKKPFKRLFDDICKEYTLEGEEIVVIGDRLFTDIFFGNLGGADTILLDPLPGKEKFFIKCARFLEVYFLKFIKIILKK